VNYSVISLSAIALLCAASAACQSAELKVEAVDHTQRIIYHSPETPGYTSWCGLWQLPDGRLRCDFVQITGPKDKPVGTEPILESKDAGETWTKIANVPTEIGLFGGGYLGKVRDSCRGMVVLPDGTLVRLVQNQFDDNESGAIERSRDGGKSWGPSIYPMAVKDCKVWPTLIRRLRDGRLVLFAGVWKRSDGEVQRNLVKTMFISSDKGKSWGKPIVLMTAQEGVCEESDFCELRDGNLFWVHRCGHYPDHQTDMPTGAAPMGSAPPASYWYSDRMQSIAYKRGKTFVPGKPEPAGLPHSGFPMVMFAKENVILHFATDGVCWTNDLGKTWTRLDIPGTPYYPKALQLKDGKIVVIGHIGSDDKYGTVDQSIVEQTFRMRVTKE